MKKIFICLASIVMMMSSFGFFTSMVTAAEQTYQQQEAQINKKFQQEILKQKNKTEKQNMQNEYNKYKRLSSKDKKKVVAYMNDPKVMADLLNRMQTAKPGVHSTPYAGVTVSSTVTEEPSSSNFSTVSTVSATGAKYRKAIWRGGLSLFGIKFLEVTGTVSYTYIKKVKVTKVTACDSFVSRNFNPVLTYDFGRCEKGKDKYMAWMTNRIVWGVAPKGLPFTFATHKIKVWGTYLPSTHGYLRKM